MYFLRFAHYQNWYILIPIFIGVLLFRWRLKNSIQYTYTLASQAAQTLKSSSLPKYILYALRTSTLLLLLLIAGRPQWVDDRSNLFIEGHDIMLALDVSRSMQSVDDPRD